MSMILALTAFKATFGLVAIFFVVFPALLHGLLGFAASQTLSERRENLEYLEGDEDKPLHS